MLNFPVNTHSSILDGLTLYEPIRCDIIEKMIHSTLLKDRKDKMDEKLQLTRYYQNYNRGLCSVHYKRKDGFNFGRVHPVGALGLHSIRRATRHTLVYDRMVDIDIVNAHPQMLIQLLKANKYTGSTELLEDYIADRESWFKKIAKRFNITENIKDICKNLILRISYGGGFTQWMLDYGFEGKMISKVVKLSDEFKDIHKFVSDNNPDIYEKVKTIDDIYNTQGRCTSYVLQQYENIILENVYQYCIDNSYIKDGVCSLCNDGILLEKRLYKPQLLDELTKYISSMVGFELSFIEKPMTESYRDSLDENIIFDLWRHDPNDGELANLFKLLYSDKFVAKDGIGYYYNGVFWEKSFDKKNIRISTWLDENLRKWIISKTFELREMVNRDKLDISKSLQLDEKCMKYAELLDKYKFTFVGVKNKEADIRIDYLTQLDAYLGKYIDRICKYLRNVRNRDGVVKDICRIIDNDSIEFNSNPFLLAFNNKIYDLETGSFIDPKPDQYISMTLGWNWGTTSKMKRAKINEILTQIFEDESIRKHYMTVLSTALCGMCIQKVFIANGCGANGKSWLNNTMLHVMGDYGYKLPSSIITKQIAEGCNPAVAQVRHKRFLLTQEPDKNAKICTSTVKEMTGGGMLNCRDLYSSDNKTKLCGTLVIECNDLPRLDETTEGVIRRIDVSPFLSRFLTPERFEAITEEEYDTGLYYKANPLYDTDDFRDEHKQAFLEILLEHFEEFKKNDYLITPPEIVQKQSMAYIQNCDDIYEWFSESYVKSDGDIIPFKDAYKNFEASNVYVNATKNERKRMNQKWFKSEIKTNAYLKGCWKPKGYMYAGTKLTADSIIGYKLKDRYNDYDIDVDFSDDDD